MRNIVLFCFFRKNQGLHRAYHLIERSLIITRFFRSYIRIKIHKIIQPKQE